jgi:hypothetical protein
MKRELIENQTLTFSLSKCSERRANTLLLMVQTIKEERKLSGDGSLECDAYVPSFETGG